MILTWVTENLHKYIYLPFAIKWKWNSPINTTNKEAGGCFFHCEETSVNVIVAELHIFYLFKCIQVYLFFFLVVNEVCVQALSGMWPLCELVWRKTHHACSEEQTCQCIEIWGIGYSGQSFLLTDYGYVLGVCLWRSTTTPVFLYTLYII